MIKSIIDSFSSLSNILWASQICGLIGFLFIGISYLFKKKVFLALATISFIFFILEQAFASLYASIIVSSICLIRNFLMFIFVLKKGKELPRSIIYLLILSMWVGEIIYMSISSSFNVWDNYLPPLMVTMSTFTQNHKKEIVIKCGATIHETGFLIYYLVYNLPLSIIRQLILVLFAIGGIVLLFVNKKNKKKEIVNNSI